MANTDPKSAAPRGARRKPRQGNPLAQLIDLVDDLARARTDEEHKSRRANLAMFVGGLPPTGRKQIVRGWRKLSEGPSEENTRFASEAERARLHDWRELPRQCRRRLHMALAYELGGSLGPAKTLLHDVLEDAESLADSLPAPEPIGGARKTAEEWRASLARDWARDLIHRGRWPEAIAAEVTEDLTQLQGPRRTCGEWVERLVRDGIRIEGGVEAAVNDLWRRGRHWAETAARLSRSDDEVMRELLVETGATADLADQLVLRWRRDRNWVAANEAIAPAKIFAEKRTIENSLRVSCRIIEKHAKAVAQEMGALAALRITPARAATLRDGPMGRLAVAISEAMPRSGAIFELVQRDHPNAVGGPWQWDDMAFAARQLADDIAEGADVDADQIFQAAKRVSAVAEEARSWVAALGTRQRSRPSKPALDAAEELRHRGISWQQIAVLLDKSGLHLDPHSPENIRKSVLSRRRRRDRKTPATK